MTDTADRKPIAVYGQPGPNLTSVLIMLKELGLAHECSKQPPRGNQECAALFTTHASGGDVCLVDPNTGTTLGGTVVMEYLVSNYDKDHCIIFRRGTPEFWLVKQWLYFQATVQGPIYAEVERTAGKDRYYIDRVQRVCEVLETQLTKQAEKHPGGDGPWVTGDKLSFADISLVAWQSKIGSILDQGEFDQSKFPQLQAWLQKMMSRPSVQGSL